MWAKRPKTQPKRLLLLAKNGFHILAKYYKIAARFDSDENNFRAKILEFRGIRIKFEVNKGDKN